MDKAKHTPGPWKQFDGYGSSDRNPIIVDSLPDVDGKCIANCICYIATTNADFQANARLIAAAPELLEALQDMLGGWRYIRQFHGDLYGVGWDRAQQAAEAAIAKATGESS